METLRCTPVPMVRSPSRPPDATPSNASDSIRAAVMELRNRLLVFYSGSAWARAQHAHGATELCAATDALERHAEDLRVPLLRLVGALERSSDRSVLEDVVRSTGQAAMRFVVASESPMSVLRRALVLYASDGMELLADLEDALARVRDVATSLLAR